MQGNWITTITGYDKKRRPVYNQSSNPYLETEDIAETQLDFAGKALQVKTQHTKGTNTPIEVVENFTYDAAGRLLIHTHSVGGQNELLAQNQYDKLGKLVRKNTGNTLSSPLQQVDYGYNIRGWLEEINDVNSLGSDLFAFKIGYNEGGNPLFNGNISSTSWRTNNVDSSLKQYNYSYDALNRITEATGASTSNYNLSGITYDKMGNILSLQRQGHVNADATLFGTMDNLTYTYDSGNKLQSVQDSGNGTYGFKDGANTTTEYTYDANGNLTSDANKQITSILYNHLNLPIEVVFENNPNKKINYEYDASGVKQKKRVNDQGNITETLYAGGFVYENNNLQFFNTAEGYVTPKPSGGYDYIYRYKDHLDNTRLSYVNIGSIGSPVLEIIEESNYYPFGLQHKGYNNVVSANSNSTAEKFKYNGKEFSEDLGLNLYEYGARMFDPATAFLHQ